MPKTRARKSDDVKELVNAFKASKSVMFVDYQGLSVPKVTSLRKELTNKKVSYIAAKKTLFALAAKEAGYDINFKAMPGMVAAAFSMEDEMAGAKVVGDALSKDKESTMKFVGGLFEGKMVDAAYAVALSKLPSKQDLLGQLLSVMNGPAAALVRLLNAKAEKGEGATA
jgi:large subunit ribosomal protein L10